MNKFFLIPIAGAVVLLFVDPASLVVAVGGLLFIAIGAFAIDRIFGPRALK